MKQGTFAQDGLCCPVRRHYYVPLRFPLDHLTLPGITGYRQTNSSFPQDEGRGGPLQLPRQLSSHSTFFAPGGSSMPAPSTKTSSMAFTLKARVRHPLVLLSQMNVTTLQTSLNVADCEFDSPRFDAGISTNAGGFTTEDLGVSSDRTCTG